MTTAAYLAWFIGTAMATIVILLVGTLAAAHLLPSRRSPDEKPDQR